MAVHAATAPQSRPADLENRPGNSSSKKDQDDGFDAAFDMAMFAISPAIAMPSGADHAARGSASSADASFEDTDATGSARSKPSAHSRGAAAIDDSGAADKTAAALTSPSENSSPKDSGAGSQFDASGAIERLALNHQDAASFASHEFPATVEIVYHAEPVLRDDIPPASASKPNHAASSSEIAAGTAVAQSGAAEAVSLVVLQRSFQANAKALQTEDSVQGYLDQLVTQ